MRKRHLSVLILAALLLLGVTTVYAQGAEDGDTMLLLLPVPQSEDLTPGEETVEAYIHRAAQPVLEQLAQMERGGRSTASIFCPTSTPCASRRSMPKRCVG